MTFHTVESFCGTIINEYCNYQNPYLITFKLKKDSVLQSKSKKYSDISVFRIRNEERKNLTLTEG